MTKISSFTGPNRFLSNFYPSKVELDGDTYETVEHAYQAAKTVDLTYRYKIQRAPTAAIAKHLGQSTPLRKDWNSIKVDVMRALLRQKFSIPALRALLLETEDAILEEGNWWGDRFWGVCRGEGENWLGRLLMAMRGEISNSSDEYHE